MVRRASAALVISLGLVVLSSSGAASAVGNLIPNGTFEGSGSGSLSGWKGSAASLSLVSPGAGGSSWTAQVAYNNSPASYYQIYANPKPVTTGGAGTVFTANATVRSDAPGKRVCLVLYESGTTTASAQRCLTTTSTFTAIATLTYTLASSGDALGLAVRQGNVSTGDSFQVDNITLTSNDTTAPSVPSGVAASASSPTEIDVSWQPSTDPDSPVAGYQVFRDGSGTPLATVTGTSYADTSVTPGSTHSYTVLAFDGVGNQSNQSSPPASATTPIGQLVGQWHMDETSGTTMVDSAGSNNGTISGSVTLGVPGATNTAYQFSGGNVQVPDNASLQPGNQTVVVSFSLKTTTTPSSPDYDLVRRGIATSTGGEWKTELQPNGQVSCAFKGSKNLVEIQAGPDVADGTWHTITCGRSATQVVLTIDGTSFSKAGATGAITDSDPITIGAYQGGGGDQYFGSLDEVSYRLG